jgi:mono/diheme cytochrome c family protein
MRHRYTLLLFSLLFIFACGTAKRGEPTYAPVPTSDPAIAQGEVVFNTHCQACHPGGETGLGPAINDKPVPGFVIRFQIRNGLGAMPAFKKDVISSEELDDLMAYIKAQRKAKKEKEEAS